MNTKPGIPDHFTIHDVRDAMHPVDACPIPDLSIDIGEGGRAAVQGVVNEIAAKVAPGHEPPTVVWTKPDDGRNGLPLGFFDDSPFVYEFTDANGPMRCHPASGVGPLTLHVKRPHVATLPDGRAVNLPAGTVLREGMTYTAEENFAALKRMAPSLAGVYERAAAKHGIRPWEATEEMAWEECPNLRPAPK